MNQDREKAKPRVLAVDDNEEALFNLEALLTHQGFEVFTASDGKQALADAAEVRPDLILSDVVMPNMGGYELAAALKQDNRLRYIPVLLLTSKGELEDIIQGLESGADDYILKPYQSKELLARINAVMRTRRLYLELQSANAARDLLQRSAENKFRFDNIIGHSESLQRVFHLVEKVKDADVPVLITGESGTGKELIASAIHYNSPRKDRAFIAQNCSALSENLLESELFGHVKGAFTGAHKDKRGLFRAAHDGTFFLDELGEMQLSLQAKLLRVLQEGTFTPVGSTNMESVDVRIVAATNRNLEKMVEEGSFREDLYYRLNVINIELPPLRERAEDIPLLLEHFLQQKNAEQKGITEAVRDKLFHYKWPGNVREFENEVERMILMSGERDLIDLADLSPRIRDSGIQKPLAASSVPRLQNLKQATLELEQQLIQQALENTEGNKSEAARVLGISRSNLLNKLKMFE